MFLSVVIVSKGRPTILAGTLASLDRQTRAPDELLLVVTGEADLPQGVRERPDLRLLFSAPGIPRQRNHALDHLSPQSEAVVFLDDDVELAQDYLRRTEGFLVTHPGVAGFSAVPILDRAEEGLLPRERAREVLRTWSAPPPPVRPRLGLYGCNMVARTAPAQSTRFDERLALYAYLEDLDFGSRLSRWGQTVDYSGARLIHLSTPSGRMSETRLGFAQVMNPVYLWASKRAIPGTECLRLIGLSLGLNVLSLLGIDRRLRITHAATDRRERLRGNLAALRLLGRGVIDPAAVRDL
ncbi:glycosyltransferase family 2 protein [Deinococcus sp. NW-56]|uniref:glycosyltransferase family 2 protein n=1 Tax=Deinococcus sp. NW-56 TaxID=2080419 RepID=UPI000CF3F943|nr:glycosyltransferase [Deinococcus sp. NW-56]